MRKVLIAGLLIVSLFILTSCSSHTITDNPENYIYKLNESINIYDNSDTRDLLGVLKITSVTVLSEEPFIHKEPAGKDTSSNPIFKDVTYNQIIQINYTYEIKNGGKSISKDNFYVTDSNSNIALENPDTEYDTIKIENTSYFAVALKSKSDIINISFNYGVFQLTPTAKIQVEVSSVSKFAEKSAANNSPKDTFESNKQNSNDTTSIESSNTDESSKKYSDNNTSIPSNNPDKNSSINIFGATNIVLYFIICILLIIIVFLIVIIISNKKKNFYK